MLVLVLVAAPCPGARETHSENRKSSCEGYRMGLYSALTYSIGKKVLSSDAVIYRICEIDYAGCSCLDMTQQARMREVP